VNCSALWELKKKCASGEEDSILSRWTFHMARWLSLLPDIAFAFPPRAPRGIGTGRDSLTRKTGAKFKMKKKMLAVDGVGVGQSPSSQ